MKWISDRNPNTPGIYGTLIGDPKDPFSFFLGYWDGSGWKIPTEADHPLTHYRSNPRSWCMLKIGIDGPPPKVILDGDGVRHIQEITLPAKYKLAKCECGIVHPVESETWFHKPMVMTEHRQTIAVFRACKKCGNFLLQELEE